MVVSSLTEISHTLHSKPERKLTTAMKFGSRVTLLSQLYTHYLFSVAIREKDDLKLYDNTQRWMTVYKKQIERVVSPEDYQNPTKIPKGLMGFGNENADKLDATGSIKKKHELAVPDFALSGTKFTQPFDHTSKGVELFNKTIQNLKNGRRKENYQINDFLNEFLTAVEPEGLQQEVETLLQSSMRLETLSCYKKITIDWIELKMN